MAEKPPTQIETASDPEEDDLDDLDDVLDEFQPKSAASKSTAEPASSAPSASGPGRPFGDDAPVLIDPGEEELEKKLQEGMKGLVDELESNPEMQKQFEQMMQELIAAGAAPSEKEAGQHLREAAEAVGQAPPAAPTAERAAGDKGGSGSGSKSGGKASEDKFNASIRRTMERMQQSDQTASSSASAAPQGTSEEEMLAQMMRELQGGGAGGGEGGEEDFNKMLMNMMTQLTNKEILYEPMKELDDKFPAWMEKNGGEGGKVGKEDMRRYKEQQKLVGEIVGRFERKGYTDENEEDREYIVERMQKMQAAGSPPPDLVGDMSAAQEALGDLDAGCPTQ